MSSFRQWHEAPSNLFDDGGSSGEADNHHHPCVPRLVGGAADNPASDGPAPSVVLTSSQLGMKQTGSMAAFLDLRRRNDGTKQPQNFGVSGGRTGQRQRAKSSNGISVIPCSSSSAKA
nr:hypothetical protein Itr_chr09CG13760 [Ipomoea trifida]GLL35694.1 hypothetical protein Itr_chr09CG13770 [Ipomoea trifida]